MFDRDHRNLCAPTGIGRAIALCAAIVATPLAVSTFAPPAWAQAAGIFGAQDSDTVTVRATVVSVDLKKRIVVLVGPSGESTSLKVGPEVANLSEVKAGDVVVARYHQAVAFVIAAPGTKTPEDMLAIAGARAVPGEKPAGGVESKLVVTALVVGVNPAAHTLSVVAPEGGEVRTLVVQDPEYRDMLPKVSVGDTITAVVSEALLVAVESAK